MKRLYYDQYLQKIKKSMRTLSAMCFSTEVETYTCPFSRSIENKFFQLAQVKTPFSPRQLNYVFRRQNLMQIIITVITSLLAK